MKCYTLLLFILYSSALLHKSQPLQSGKKAGEPTMKSPLGALFLGNLSSLSFYFHGHSWPCLDFFVVSCFYNYSSDYVPIYFLHIIIQEFKLVFLRSLTLLAFELQAHTVRKNRLDQDINMTRFSSQYGYRSCPILNEKHFEIQR